MERLTRPCKDTENGKYIPYTTGTYTGIFPDCTLGKVVERLAYYEDLEEQGRLEIHMSKEEEKRMLKKMCLNCKYYTREPCNQTRCPILAKLYE
jgi:hypothetical protein